MSFNGVGSYTLDPGETLAVGITHNDNDTGAQWIMANPTEVFGNWPQTAALAVSNQRKVVDRPAGNDGGRFVAYWCDVKNVGPDSTNFDTQGGGNT